MKKLLAGVAVLGVLMGTITAAQADEALRIGMVDVRKVVLQSKPGQAHRAERAKAIKEQRDKFGKEDVAIRAMRDKLEKDKLLLTEKQRADKQREIEQRIAALQKAVQEAEQEMRRREAETMKTAESLLLRIVGEIAAQEKLSMVIDSKQPGLVWVGSAVVDITDKVMKVYESKAGK